ncbi:MAG TPA: ATP-binding protein [Stellaceae bacterium]|nr:ATP-binding protein [Stellaceae bacterium]
MQFAAGLVIPDFLQTIALTAVILIAFWQMGARRVARGSMREEVTIGLAFGAIMALATANPIMAVSGVTVDARAALMVLAGLFGGPIAAAIAIVLGFDYRSLLAAGPGALGGAVTMLMSAVVGVSGHRWLRRRGPNGIGAPHLLVLGLGGAVSAVAGMLLLPETTRDNALQSIALPLGIRIFCGVALFGFLMLREQRRSVLEAELAKSQERFRAMSANAPGVLYQRVMLPDGSTHYTYVSDQCQAIFGLSPDELVADSGRLLNVIHAGDRKRFLESITASARDLTIWDEQLRILHPGRPITWVRSIARPHRRADGATVWDGFVLDVTERVESDLALANKTDILQATLDTIPDGLLVLDGDLKLIANNEQLFEMLELDRGAILAADDSALAIRSTCIERGDLGPGNRRAQLARLDAEIRDPVPRQYEQQLKSGRWIEVRSRAPSRGGRVLVIRDITVHKEREAAREIAKEAAERARLAAEQASQAKSAFLANMSHEIRTPMNGVMGAAHLLLGTTLDSEQHRYTDVIVKCGRHLLTIIDDILDISKMAAGRVKLETIEFTLPDVVRTALDLLGPRAREKALRIETAIESSATAPVLGDPTRLRQVLVNLLGNAIKFTETGSVTVAARRLGTGADRALIRIEVADTGIGIASDARDRLFHNFSQADETITRRFGGTGLGLAISKQIVELMGGSIGVESELGQGSTFWVSVEFPLAPESIPPLPVETMAELPPPPRHCRVLLAEDVEINRMIAGEMLRKMGCDVTFAVDGLEAYEVALADDFDLVLMDIQMPRMDGVEATKRIRAAGGPRGGVPIVALTAHAIASERDSYLAAGMDDYLTKPFEPRQLSELLDRLSMSAVGFEERRAPKPAAAADLLDERRLDELAAIMSPDRFAGLVDAWIESAEELAAKVAAAGDAALAGEAHKLTGSAANFGADALASLARRIEAEARAGNANSVRALVGEIDELYRETAHAMRERLRLLRQAQPIPAK